MDFNPKCRQKEGVLKLPKCCLRTSCKYPPPPLDGGRSNRRERRFSCGRTITEEKTFSQKMRETEIFRAKAAAARTQRVSRCWALPPDMRTAARFRLFIPNRILRVTGFWYGLSQGEPRCRHMIPYSKDKLEHVSNTSSLPIYQLEAPR